MASEPFRRNFELMIEGVVFGRPVPQGSMRPVTSKTTGRSFVKQSDNLLSWRQECKHVADKLMRERRLEVSARAIEMHLCFIYERPAKHFHTSKSRLGELREDAPEEPSEGAVGDVDKLTRAFFDACSKIVYRDDKQVVGLVCDKAWGTRQSVVFSVFQRAR